MSVITAPDRLFSPEQVANILGVTGSTVRRWVAQGELDAVRLGEGRLSRIRIPADAVERFVRVPTTKEHP